MKLIAFVILLLVLPLSLASMDVDISLAKNDIVTQNFNLKFTATEQYDSFEFIAISKPLSIDYDESYTIQEVNNNYIIAFDKDIQPGEQEISFTLLYDDLVEKTNSGKVFRTAFSFPDDVKIKITLPENHILSESPSAIPNPDDITTDGQRITLSWQFKDNAAISVFYQGQNYFDLLISALIILVMSGALVYIISKHKISKAVTATLSENEKLVIKEIKKGVIKQKDIAKNLNISKSKMSKLMRKLEEKGIIEKKPYFKTNLIKLKI